MFFKSVKNLYALSATVFSVFGYFCEGFRFNAMSHVFIFSFFICQQFFLQMSKAFEKMNCLSVIAIPQQQTGRTKLKIKAVYKSITKTQS
jgi:hypothetical protein